MKEKSFSYERLFLALLCRCFFLSVAYAEEGRVGIVELLGDIGFALLGLLRVT